MESLTKKRSRLRDELQEAYSDWLSSARGAHEFDCILLPEIDVTGCADESKAAWYAYQAAKIRLVEAYAEGSKP